MKTTVIKSGIFIVMICLLGNFMLFAQQNQMNKNKQPKIPREPKRVFDNNAKEFFQQELGPDWEKIMLEKVRQNDPLMLEELEIMKQKNTQRYESSLLQLFKEYKRFDRLKETDPERYKKVVKQHKLNRDSRALVREYRKSEDDNRKNEIKTELRNILSELFTLRESEKEEKIQKLEQELEKLREMVALRKQKKQDIIDNRLNELLGEHDILRW